MGDENTTTAQLPMYQTEEANQSIHLYSGPIAIEQANLIEQGDGTLDLVWLPCPHIRFQFSSSNPKANIAFDDPMKLPTFLRMPALGIASYISIQTISHDYKSSTNPLKISGNLVESLIMGSGDSLAHILFHLPNFQSLLGSSIRSPNLMWFGRLVLEAEGWAITIDSIEGLQHLKESLGASSGYGITHVGKLQRSDGARFNAEQAGDILDALFHFLSFTRGFWVPPMLPVGFDEMGVKVWEKWEIWNSDPWQGVNSWFLSDKPQVLNGIFAGFMRRWRDQVWSEALRLAIGWYVESNTTNSEHSLVLSQTTLEMLSWVTLVEEGRLLSEDGFDKLWASDRIRLLLSQSGVQLAVPNSQKTLTQLSSDEKWQDGPQAITEIRNRMVHPKVIRPIQTTGSRKKPKNVLGYPISARYEAMQLSLWYVERILLRLFSFAGVQSNNRLEKYVIDR